MELKRVVVTGIGALTPIGNNVPEFWDNMLKGVSGAAPITYFNTELFKTKFACEVKGFNVLDIMENKEARKMDAVSHFAVAATREAMTDSGLELAKENSQRIGVIVGSAIGGFQTLHESFLIYMDNDKVPRFNPFLLPRVLMDSISGNLALHFGLQGPNYMTSSACASGGNAIIDAYNCIRLGRCDIMVSGGAEACIAELTVGGFDAMRALSTRNDEPQRASRPFDVDRDGFVMGEGAAILILEELEHALARGAHIYAEMVGGGLSCDAYHITAPRPDGAGAAMSMRLAMEEGGVMPEEVDYINAHGTSTVMGDVSECNAIADVFGDHANKLLISSTKSMTGHMLGAAPAIESIASILAMNKGIAPPTINLDHKDTVIPDWNFCAHKPVERDIRVALSNSFGFGGHNLTLLYKKYE
ncbi:MAG: beta-ketoacyl-[acyl-carrier-protein] synthase II [Bacteroidetes bacterium]|nr:beta-ketoacyl-[acyl-carrier-protein] synthase II [Bacteroidota bacterium]